MLSGSVMPQPPQASTAAAQAGAAGFTFDIPAALDGCTVLLTGKRDDLHRRGKSDPGALVYLGEPGRARTRTGPGTMPGTMQPCVG